MSSDIYRLETQDAESFPACGSQDMDFAKAYHYLFEEIADPRVANLPLMKDPFAVTLILLAYLGFVLHIGPRYMKNRKPYKLNSFMILYNGLLAIASGVTCYGVLTSGYTTNLSLGCEPYRLSYEPEPLRMVDWIWWIFIMKIVELSDTIVFVLRKKSNQISILHVYHHSSTVCFAWINCKYIPGGMWTFIVIPNCIVHVIMYTYYLLAACGPKVREIINPVKKYITTLQMIQFTVILIHIAQAFLPSCDPDRKYFAWMYALQVIIIFYMFYRFYKKTYTKKKLE
ncbi:PREDICTED: elongation of very long chain fatty acids protein 1-like isoform X1 [Polistes dominula]|uniref:Elongation of very long chain fatty acids protein n=2 Tax=Polistes dominula TaxID=743375 RepID=A0ABM1JDU8_POLDO|nr:PREDICTED: elongation of very long chain fatty acids protein 1-like isoform X1 [Polistes dominula]